MKREDAVALLESEGYAVIPPSDIPPVIVKEDELLATVEGLDRHNFIGALSGRSVPIGERYFANHSEEFEYRRVVAHLAMLFWYRDNLDHEQAVGIRARELLAEKGIDAIWKAKKGQWRKAVKTARRELAVSS